MQQAFWDLLFSLLCHKTSGKRNNLLFVQFIFAVFVVFIACLLSELSVRLPYLIYSST